MRAFVRLVEIYLKPYWARLLLASVLTCAAALSSFLFTFMGKMVVDDVLEVRARPPAARELSRDDPISPFSDRDYAKADPEIERTLDDAFMAKTGKTRTQKLKLLLLFLFAYLLIHLSVAAFRWISRYHVSLTSQDLVFRLRSDLHTKLQSLQMTYFDQVQTGKLMARIIDDVDVIRTHVTNAVINLATYLAMLVVGCVVLYLVNWRMALVATGALPLYATAYRFFVKRIREHTRRARELNAKTYGFFQQKISGVRLVKSFVRERGELLKYHGLGKSFFRIMVSRSALQSALGGIAMLISGVGAAFVLWYGAVLVRDGRLTLGEMFFFHGTAAILFTPVVQLADTNIVFQWLAVVIGRVFQILDEEVTIEDQPDAVRLDTVGGLIEFENVSLTYQGNDPRFRGEEEREKKHSDDTDQPEAQPQISTRALRNINLRIEPGQMVCIMGASGSGKSSLVSLIPRLYQPSEGRITIDRQDISEIKLTSLRRHIGLVPQESAIFSGTLADNIRYGEPYAPIEDVAEAAKAAEIDRFIEELPDKYDTRVGEQGVTLSGGQKQRLSIARALLTRPSILLLDDCTSALDAKTEARLQETLSRILRDHTSIVITHRSSMAMKADRIVVLDDGQVVEQGTHDELLAARKYYWRIFQSQQKDISPAIAV